eukprot:GHRR01034905.1.p1 GENE.GHRR01034905.1~~GHRR01034905.1.p1  ORF type:complete len:101 (-),score=29.99 GHRR01034905.1:214-516(-)
MLCHALSACYTGAGEVPVDTQIILSSHDFKQTPSAEELQARAKAMWAAGADVVKIATMANDISDAAAVLSLLHNKSGRPSTFRQQHLNSCLQLACQLQLI